MDRTRFLNDHDDRRRRGSQPIGARARPVGLAACLTLTLTLGLAPACSEGGDASPSGNAAPSASEPKVVEEAASDLGSGLVETPEDPRSQKELIAAGRSVYNANCIACHAIDPTVDGALGPAVAGSSLELLRARIVHGNYPEGYEPKRPSRVMVALPHLEPKLPELAAYLQSLDG